MSHTKEIALESKVLQIRIPRAVTASSHYVRDLPECVNWQHNLGEGHKKRMGERIAPFAPHFRTYVV